MTSLTLPPFVYHFGKRGSIHYKISNNRSHKGPAFRASQSAAHTCILSLQHSPQVPVLGFEPSRAESRQKQLPSWSFPVEMCGEEAIFREGSERGRGELGEPVLSFHLTVGMCVAPMWTHWTEGSTGSQGPEAETCRLGLIRTQWVSSAEMRGAVPGD